MDISIEDYFELLFKESAEQLAINQSRRLDSTLDTAISSYSGIYNPTGSYKKFDYVFSQEEGKFFYAKRDIDNGPGFNFSGANRFFLDPNGPFDNEFGQTHYIFDEANLISADNQPIRAGQKIKLEGSLEGGDGFYEILDYKTNVSSADSTTNKEAILARLSGTIISQHESGSFWFTSSWFLKTAGSQGDETFFYNPNAGNSFVFSPKIGWIHLSLENESEQYESPHEIAFAFIQNDLAIQWVWTSESVSRYARETDGEIVRPETFLYIYPSENGVLGSAGWLIIGDPITEESRAMHAMYCYSYSLQRHFFFNKGSGGSLGLSTVEASGSSVINSISFVESFGVEDVTNVNLPVVNTDGRFRDGIRSRIQVRGLSLDSSNTLWKSNFDNFDFNKRSQSWLTEDIASQLIDQGEAYLFNWGQYSLSGARTFWDHKYSRTRWRTQSSLKTWYLEDSSSDSQGLDDKAQSHSYNSENRGHFVISKEHYQGLNGSSKKHFDPDRIYYGKRLIGWAGQDAFSNIKVKAVYAKIIDINSIQAGGKYVIYELGSQPTDLSSVTDYIRTNINRRWQNGDLFTAHSNASGLTGDTKVFKIDENINLRSGLLGEGIELSSSQEYNDLAEESMLVQSQSFSFGSNGEMLLQNSFEDQTIYIAIGKDMFESNISKISTREQKGDHSITISSIVEDINQSDAWTTDDFFFDADYGTNVDFSADTYVEEFGDGYYVARPKDINSMNCKFNLTFKNRTSREANAILHFLDSHQGQFEDKHSSDFLEYKAGIEGFRWDGNSTFHPYDSLDNQSKKFYCTDFSHTINFENSHDLTVTLKTLSTSLLNKSESLFVKSADEWSDGVGYGSNDVVFSPINHQYYYCKPAPVIEISVDSETGESETTTVYKDDSIFVGAPPVQTSEEWSRDTGYFENLNADVWTQDFKWRPTAKLSINHKPRVKEKKTKGSYSQIYSDGINVNMLTMDLSFENRDDTETYAILHFLEQRYGCIPFRFTAPAPYDNPRSFICRDWSHVYNYKNNHSIKVTFIEFPFNIGSSEIANLISPSPVAPGRLMLRSPVNMSSQSQPISASKPFVKRIEFENIGSGEIEITSLGFDGMVKATYSRQFGENYITPTLISTDTLTDLRKSTILNDILPMDNKNDSGEEKSWSDWLNPGDNSSSLSILLVDSLELTRPDYWTVADFTKEMLRLIYLYMPEKINTLIGDTAGLNKNMVTRDSVSIIVKDLFADDGGVDLQFQVEKYNHPDVYENTENIIIAIQSSEEYKNIVASDVKIISQNLTADQSVVKVNSLVDYSSDQLRFDQASRNFIPLQREQIKLDRYTADSAEQGFQSLDKEIKGTYHQKNNGDILTPYKTRIESSYFLNRDLFLKYGSNKLGPFERGYIDLVINEANDSDFYKYIGDEDSEAIAWENLEGEKAGRIKVSIINAGLVSKMEIDWRNAEGGARVYYQAGETNTTEVSVNNWVAGDAEEEALIDSAKPLSEASLCAPSVYFLKHQNNPVHASNVVRGRIYCVFENEDSSKNSFNLIGCSMEESGALSSDAFIATKAGRFIEWGDGDMVLEVRSLESTKHEKAGGAYFVASEYKGFNEDSFMQRKSNPLYNNGRDYSFVLDDIIDGVNIKNKSFNIEHFYQLQKNPRLGSKLGIQWSGDDLLNKVSVTSASRIKNPKFFAGFPIDIYKGRESLKYYGTSLEKSFAKQSFDEDFSAYPKEKKINTVMNKSAGSLCDDGVYDLLLSQTNQESGELSFSGATYRRLSQNSRRVSPQALLKGDSFTIKSIDLETATQNMVVGETYLVKEEDLLVDDTRFDVLTSWSSIKPNDLLIKHIIHSFRARPEQQISQWSGLSSYKAHINSTVNLNDFDQDFIDSLRSADSMESVIEDVSEELRVYGKNIPLNNLVQGDSCTIIDDSDYDLYFTIGLDRNIVGEKESLVGLEFIYNGEKPWGSLDHFIVAISELSNGDVFKITQQVEGFDYSNIGISTTYDVGSLVIFSPEDYVIPEEHKNIQVRRQLPLVSVGGKGSTIVDYAGIRKGESYSILENPAGDSSIDLLAKIGCAKTDIGFSFTSIEHGLVAVPEYRDPNTVDTGLRFAHDIYIKMYMPTGTEFVCLSSPLTNALEVAQSYGSNKYIDLSNTVRIPFYKTGPNGREWHRYGYEDQSLFTPVFGNKYLFESPEFFEFIKENFGSYQEQTYLGSGVEGIVKEDWDKVGSFAIEGNGGAFFSSNNFGSGILNLKGIPGPHPLFSWCHPAIVGAIYSYFAYLLQQSREQNGSLVPGIKLGRELNNYIHKLLGHKSQRGAVNVYKFNKTSKLWEKTYDTISISITGGTAAWTQDKRSADNATSAHFSRTISCFYLFMSFLNSLAGVKTVAIGWSGIGSQTTSRNWDKNLIEDWMASADNLEFEYHQHKWHDQWEKISQSNIISMFDKCVTVPVAYGTEGNSGDALWRNFNSGEKLRFSAMLFSNGSYNLGGQSSLWRSHAFVHDLDWISWYNDASAPTKDEILSCFRETPYVDGFPLLKFPSYWSWLMQEYYEEYLWKLNIVKNDATNHEIDMYTSGLGGNGGSLVSECDAMRIENWTISEAIDRIWNSAPNTSIVSFSPSSGGDWNHLNVCNNAFFVKEKNLNYGNVAVKYIYGQNSAIQYFAASKTAEFVNQANSDGGQLKSLLLKDIDNNFQPEEREQQDEGQSIQELVLSKFFAGDATVEKSKPSDSWLELVGEVEEGESVLWYKAVPAQTYKITSVNNPDQVELYKTAAFKVMSASQIIAGNKYQLLFADGGESVNFSSVSDQSTVGVGEIVVFNKSGVKLIQENASLMEGLYFSEVKNPEVGDMFRFRLNPAMPVPLSWIQKDQKYIIMKTGDADFSSCNGPNESSQYVGQVFTSTIDAPDITGTSEISLVLSDLSGLSFVEINPSSIENANIPIEGGAHEAKLDGYILPWNTFNLYNIDSNSVRLNKGSEVFESKFSVDISTSNSSGLDITIKEEEGDVWSVDAFYITEGDRFEILENPDNDNFSLVGSTGNNAGTKFRASRDGWGLNWSGSSKVIRLEDDCSVYPEDFQKFPDNCQTALVEFTHSGDISSVGQASVDEFISAHEGMWVEYRIYAYGLNGGNIMFPVEMHGDISAPYTSHSIENWPVDSKMAELIDADDINNENHFVLSVEKVDPDKGYDQVYVQRGICKIIVGRYEAGSVNERVKAYGVIKSKFSSNQDIANIEIELMPQAYTYGIIQSESGFYQIMSKEGRLVYLPFENKSEVISEWEIIATKKINQKKYLASENNPIVPCSSDFAHALPCEIPDDYNYNLANYEDVKSVFAEVLVPSVNGGIAVMHITLDGPYKFIEKVSFFEDGGKINKWEVVDSELIFRVVDNRTTISEFISEYSIDNIKIKVLNLPDGAEFLSLASLMQEQQSVSFGTFVDRGNFRKTSKIVYSSDMSREDQDRIEQISFDSNQTSNNRIMNKEIAEVFMKYIDDEDIFSSVWILDHPVQLRNLKETKKFAAQGENSGFKQPITIANIPENLSDRIFSSDQLQGGKQYVPIGFKWNEEDSGFFMNNGSAHVMLNSEDLISGTFYYSLDSDFVNDGSFHSNTMFIETNVSDDETFMSLDFPSIISQFLELKSYGTATLDRFYDLGWFMNQVGENWLYNPWHDPTIFTFRPSDSSGFRSSGKVRTLVYLKDKHNAVDWNSSTSYGIYDIVVYEGYMYQSNQIPTAGQFIEEEWEGPYDAYGITFDDDRNRDITASRDSTIDNARDLIEWSQAASFYPDGEEYSKTITFDVPALVHSGNNIGKMLSTQDLNNMRVAQSEVSTINASMSTLVKNNSYKILEPISLNPFYAEVGEIYTVSSLDGKSFNYSIFGGTGNESVGDTFECTMVPADWAEGEYEAGSVVKFDRKFYQSSVQTSSVPGADLEWSEMDESDRFIQGNFPSLGIVDNQVGRIFKYVGDFSMTGIIKVKIENEFTLVGDLLGVDANPTNLQFKWLNKKGLNPEYEPSPSWLYALSNVYSKDHGFINPGVFTNRNISLYTGTEAASRVRDILFSSVRYSRNFSKKRFNFSCKKAEMSYGEDSALRFNKKIINTHTLNIDDGAKYSLSNYTQADMYHHAFSDMYEDSEEFLHKKSFRQVDRIDFSNHENFRYGVIYGFEVLLYGAIFEANNKKDYVTVKDSSVLSTISFNTVVTPFGNKQNSYYLLRYTNGSSPSVGDMIGKGTPVFISCEESASGEDEFYGCINHNIFEEGGLDNADNFVEINNFKDVVSFARQAFGLNNNIFVIPGDPEAGSWNPFINADHVVANNYNWISNLQDSFYGNEYLNCLSKVYNEKASASMTHNIPIDIGKYYPGDNSFKSIDSFFKLPRVTTYAGRGDALPEKLTSEGLKINTRIFLDLSEKQKQELYYVEQKLNAFVKDNFIFNVSLYEASAGRFGDSADIFAAAWVKQKFLGMKDVNGSYRPSPAYGQIMYNPVDFLDENNAINFFDIAYHSYPNFSKEDGVPVSGFYSTTLHEFLHVLGVKAQNVGEVIDDVALVASTLSNSFKQDRFALRTSNIGSSQREKWGWQFYGKKTLEEYGKYVREQLSPDSGADTTGASIDPYVAHSPGQIGVYNGDYYIATSTPQVFDESISIQDNNYPSLFNQYLSDYWMKIELGDDIYHAIDRSGKYIKCWLGSVALYGNGAHFLETCRSIADTGFIQPSFPFAIMSPITLANRYRISDKSSKLTLGILEDMGWNISENAYNNVEDYDSKYMEPNVEPGITSSEWGSQWMERNIDLLI